MIKWEKERVKFQDNLFYTTQLFSLFRLLLLLLKQSNANVSIQYKIRYRASPFFFNFSFYSILNRKWMQKKEITISITFKQKKIPHKYRMNIYFIKWWFRFHFIFIFSFFFLVSFFFSFLNVMSFKYHNNNDNDDEEILETNNRFHKWRRRKWQTHEMKLVSDTNTNDNRKYFSADQRERRYDNEIFGCN